MGLLHQQAALSSKMKNIYEKGVFIVCLLSFRKENLCCFTPVEKQMAMLVKYLFK